MITFLVVGRNDGYGINLHKRTAISLNYFASLCRDDDDEIIYVDCNTPAHDVTLVEAIADTLTPEARRRLKIYRVTGEQMQAAIGETPLPFSDELSRNVGIRRSNPRNNWLLSTNCDILVHPLAADALHDVLQGLAPRFYACPRIGVPANQWQSLDRMSVRQIAGFCDAVVKQGARFPAEKPEPWLRFSAVGDFQLAPREQWFAIRGCEEGMKLWGHSDANNSRRLSLLNGGGRTPDLADALRVIHLDHNASEATAHRTVLPQNDWKLWIEDVTAPASHNGDHWGLANEPLPLITLPQAGELAPETILKTQRRQRSLLTKLRVKLASALWQTASPVLHWLDRKSGQ